MANQRDLKAFVRYDGSGRVVAGSLVLRKKKPKVGRWEEILTYECCNDIPTTSTTTTSSAVPTARYGQITNSGNSGTWAWNACNGFASSIVVYTNTNVTPIPAGTSLYTSPALTTLIPYSDGAIAINGSVYDIVNGRTNPFGGTGQECQYITTTSTTTTSPSTYYNAGLVSDGTTVVCNNSGPYSLPLIITDGCSPGGVTLASGLYSDYGIPNNSLICINLNNGNVLQGETFGSSLMFFGCISCSGTTTSTTTIMAINSQTGSGGPNPSIACTSQGSSVNVYYTGNLGTGVALYTDSVLSTPYNPSSWGSYIKLYFNAEDQVCTMNGNIIQSYESCASLT